MIKPTGLKVYKNLLSLSEVEDILSQNEYKTQNEVNTVLFKYYGNYKDAVKDDFKN